MIINVLFCKNLLKGEQFNRLGFTCLPCPTGSRLLAMALQAGAAARGSVSCRCWVEPQTIFHTGTNSSRGAGAGTKKQDGELPAGHRAFQLPVLNRVAWLSGQLERRKCVPVPRRWGRCPTLGKVPHAGAAARTPAAPPLSAARCLDGSARVQQYQVSVVSSEAFLAAGPRWRPCGRPGAAARGSERSSGTGSLRGDAVLP